MPTGFTDLVSTNTPTWNVMSFLQDHPEVVSSWNEDQGIKDFYGTLENYALQHAANNGTPEEQIAATSYMQTQTKYQPAATPDMPANGNFTQEQNASQGGQYQTSGNATTNQQQTTGQNSQQQQTGTTTNAGTTNQQQATQQQGTTAEQQARQELQNYIEQQQSQKQGTTQSTETGTTSYNTSDISKPIDTLGFGALLQSQIPGATQTDTERNAFLRDVINTGGSGFGSQVDQAVRQAMSGRGMVGAGESAGARASAYTAEQVARNNMNQRLSASEQLAGPTAVQTLSTSANPYIGTQRDTSGTENSTKNTTGTYNEQGTTNVTGQRSTAGTSNTTGMSNMTGLSNLTGSNTNTGTSVANTAAQNTGWSNLLGTTAENNSGVSTAQSSQAAAGLIPEGKQVSSGGGCVICTAGLELGLCDFPRVLHRVIDYKINRAWSRYRNAAKAYFFFYTPLAKWFLGHPRLARSFWPLAKMVVYEELRISGRSVPKKVLPWVVHGIWHWSCTAVGKCMHNRPVVTDPVIISIAKKFNVFFKTEA